MKNENQDPMNERGSKQGTEPLNETVAAASDSSSEVHKSSFCKPHQTVLGMPMNWDLKNWHLDIWNPNDDRIFPPKSFGVGWGMNMHAILKRTGVIGR